MSTSIKGSGRVATVNGTPVHFYERGQGEALVLLHGGGPGATGWGNYSQNVESLSQTLRVIVPDLPGFGESGLCDLSDGYLSAAAVTLAGLLDELDIKRAHFVGNSLGGGTALSFALRYPARAGSLILMNPAGAPASLFMAEPSAEMKLLTHYYDPPGPSVERMQAFCEEMLYCTDLATPEFVKERFEESIRPGRKEGQQSAIAALRAQESEAKKGSVWSASALITQPTLLLWGREDRPAPLDKGLMWLKRIPNATLTIVPYCGHWVQMEYPQMFDSLTRTFIQNA